MDLEPEQSAVEPPAVNQASPLYAPEDAWRRRGLRLGLGLRSYHSGPFVVVSASAPTETKGDEVLVPVNGLKLSLALPLWQTAMAGGLACVAHRAVAASVADLMACPTRKLGMAQLAREAGPTLARNAMKVSAGFPFGAVCCSLYVPTSEGCTWTLLARKPYQ